MNEQNPLIIETSRQLSQLSADEALALCVFEDEPRVPLAGHEELRREVERLVRDGEFDGRAETALLLHATAPARGAESAAGARRLLLLGVGPHADFDLRAMGRAAGMAARRARQSRIKTLWLIPPASDERDASQGSGSQARLVRAIAEGAIMGLYDGDFYQKHEEDQLSLERLRLVLAEEDAEVRASLERARIIAESVNWSRTLSDEPGASLPPREFARRAALMAQQFGLRVETLDAEEIRARGMGGLYAVGQGSAQPPALIVVHYEPPDAPDDGELWAFVGKGITFDTGGISLKHGLDMYEMKSDMAGGAAVLGAMRAIAQLKPPRRVVGIVPSAENMPSGSAVKPGDIIRTLAGFTIEVVDTDAEGRLVLVDGIAYAKQLGATRIVDLATLTGSIVIALGSHRTGLFSNNDEWASLLQRAAERAGEPVWRMPVGDEYKSRIESPIADFKNYGGRPDATAAALLLSKFAAETPWVHLDIAGTAWHDEPQPYAPKGTTGTGVRTLVELTCDGIG